MKPTAEWLQEIDGKTLFVRNSSSHDFVNQVKRDAWKQGMKDAAGIVRSYSHPEFELGKAPSLLKARENFMDAIILAANQKNSL